MPSWHGALIKHRDILFHFEPCSQPYVPSWALFTAVISILSPVHSSVFHHEPCLQQWFPSWALFTAVSSIMSPVQSNNFHFEPCSEQCVPSWALFTAVISILSPVHSSVASWTLFTAVISIMSPVHSYVFHFEPCSRQYFPLNCSGLFTGSHVCIWHVKWRSSTFQYSSLWQTSRVIERRHQI